jgi:hypothetical protein
MTPRSAASESAVGSGQWAVGCRLSATGSLASGFQRPASGSSQEDQGSLVRLPRYHRPPTTRTSDVGTGCDQPEAGRWEPVADSRRAGEPESRRAGEPESPQPTADSRQPTADSPQPTAHSRQPTADSPQPTAHSPQPTAHSPQPTAHSRQPAARSTEPRAARWNSVVGPPTSSGAHWLSP